MRINEFRVLRLAPPAREAFLLAHNLQYFHEDRDFLLLKLLILLLSNSLKGHSSLFLTS